MKGLRIILGNRLPISKTSWASSHSVYSPKPEIHSAPTSTSVRFSLTTQLTLSLKLSNSSYLLSQALQLFFLLPASSQFSLFCSKSHKVFISQALISSKKEKKKKKSSPSSSLPLYSTVLFALTPTV